MIIVDAHEDIAYNMLSFGRDYTRSAAETRRIEAGTVVPERNGDALLGYSDYLRGKVGFVFSTLFAGPQRPRTQEWDKLVYSDFNQAHDLYRRQVDAYHELAGRHPQQFKVILTQGDLAENLAAWEKEDARPPAPKPDPKDDRPAFERDGRDAAGDDADEKPPEPSGPPVGLVILMEGAEGVRQPAELEEWWGWGVRLVGPAWAGTRYCGGTREPGPLTSDGYALLEAMSDFGFALDLSHMDEEAALQALDAYPRRIIASHANAARLVARPGIELNTNRHLSDRVLRGLIERGGVIGVVPFNVFLMHGWQEKDGREAVTLQHVAAQIDYICQMAGDARHAGIGSDFDGGFGLQSVPAGIDTVADLQKLAPILAEKGYTGEDCAAILGGNWLSLLKEIMP